MDAVSDHVAPQKVKAGAHSCVLAPHLKDLFVAQGEGKYGSMFPDLPACQTDEKVLTALGRPNGKMDENKHEHGKETDSVNVPAGTPFFGQFIAHDITADRSLLAHHSNFAELRNFRRPMLDLEPLYAGGPSGSPFLFDLEDSDKFIIGINDAGQARDLPRNQQGRALIGDPRNDVHMLIAQLHVAFLRFHNNVVDLLREQGVDAASVFEEARTNVIWHYQWIITHEFLPLIAGAAITQDVLDNGPRFYKHVQSPFIPVEFADAAYRFGHTQVRHIYELNDQTSGSVFPDYGGTRPIKAAQVIEWRRFFDVDSSFTPQKSKRIDTLFAHSLMSLPESVTGEVKTAKEHSLAYRDLERGRALGLPAGETLAQVMGVAPLTAAEVNLPGAVAGSTPLYYYLLKEAETRQQGERLGDVGARIVAEVLIGLIDADARSYRRAAPDWTPTIPSANDDDFTLADLFRFAGVA